MTDMGKMIAENTAKNHTNTGLFIMYCRIFSDIIAISFKLHLKYTFTYTAKIEVNTLFNSY